MSNTLVPASQMSGGYLMLCFVPYDNVSVPRTETLQFLPSLWFQTINWLSEMLLINFHLLPSSFRIILTVVSADTRWKTLWPAMTKVTPSLGRGQRGVLKQQEPDEQTLQGRKALAWDLLDVCKLPLCGAISSHVQWPQQWLQYLGTIVMNWIVKTWLISRSCLVGTTWGMNSILLNCTGLVHSWVSGCASLFFDDLCCRIKLILGPTEVGLQQAGQHVYLTTLEAWILPSISANRLEGSTERMCTTAVQLRPRTKIKPFQSKNILQLDLHKLILEMDSTVCNLIQRFSRTVLCNIIKSGLWSQNIFARSSRSLSGIETEAAALSWSLGGAPARFQKR